MQLKSNSELQGGKYRIIRVLGQGGFGITYLAENTLLDRRIAIKEFFPKEYCGRGNTSHVTLGTQHNAETVGRLKARFLKEAKNIAKLSHPGVVRVYDVFEENDTAYYVMDYIDGENLSEMVKRGGPLSEAKAVAYVAAVGDALDYIHSRNMTHFDVKPANIVVRRSDDRPVLIDFGLSKQYDSQGSATSTLMQGVSQGYSPIELYNIGSVSTFSPQTDVYSLGATLYYLISGKVPPAASDIIFDSSWQMSTLVSERVGKVIRDAMRPSRQERTQSVALFISNLSVKSDLSDKRGHKKSLNEENNSEDTVLIGQQVKKGQDKGGLSNNEPCIIYFKASKKVYEVGEHIALTWQLRDATTVSLDGRKVNPSVRSKTIRYTTSGDKVLTLRAGSGNKVVEKKLAISVKEKEISKPQQPIHPKVEKHPEILSFNITPATGIYVDDVVELSWDTKNASNIELLPLNKTVPGRGKEQIHLKEAGDYKFELIAYNGSETARKDIFITVSKVNNNPLFYTRLSRNTYDYETKKSALDLKDKLDMPTAGGCLSFVIGAFAFLLLSLEVHIFSGVGHILQLILAPGIGGVLCVFVLSQIVSKYRISQWIKEHPDDPRCKYLID